ncbi:hypothetical protein E8E11_000561 [Didymella keratinophila]|nr:hypothetical protein E8E11_000561 [Didymella keratinophila]
MFYPFGDEDFRGMKNDISTNADSEYSIEAAAYSELQGTSVEGSATPRYHGSWTMDIIQDEQDERITRQVRLIFTEQISGVRTADIDLFELTPDVKEAIMINVIEADYHVRRAGVRHYDIAPETSFCLTAAENEDHPARAELRIEESDVVRVSYTYITHPLLIAINRKHTTPIGVKAEEKLDEFRQDFSFNADQDNPTRKMIMIIEFKRNHLIKLAEFTVASKATLEEGQNWLISEERTTLK